MQAIGHIEKPEASMNHPWTELLALGLILLCATSQAAEWKMQSGQIRTRWAAAVNPRHVLSEYPRPQLTRSHWENLNGLWRYTITSRQAPMPTHFQGVILVPYPLESALSGVERPLRPDQLLWYRRTIRSPAANGERTLLHFGAVDYEATVYLNGHSLGTHRGGYQSFTLELTQNLRAGDNELVVRVYDPTEAGPNPHGKQGLQYTSSSGIWQTVWLETVPRTYIDDLVLTPNVDQRALHVQAKVEGDADGVSLEAIVRTGATVVVQQILPLAGTIQIPNPHLWSPDDPHLYDLEVRLVKAGRTLDTVKSYFGLRKIELQADAAGGERIFLNGHPTFNLGVLDQGFWPDGLYTAPTDEALKFDIQALKAMGFNAVRKHIKIEPERWYYYCDLLGLLVWQDMVNPSSVMPEARTEFESEIPATLRQLHNHPSIITWVLFNESFGTYDQEERLVRWIKKLDPSRLVNGHSGPYSQTNFNEWRRHADPARMARLMSGTIEDPALLEDVQEASRIADWGGSDMTDLHHYPDPRMPPVEPGKAAVLGEYGGLGVVIDEHIWNDLDPGYGYRMLPAAKMTEAYAQLTQELAALAAQGLSGSIYTQITDVEQEQNGLITYDRSVIKIPVAKIAALNRQLVPESANYDAAIRGFAVKDADLTPEAESSTALWQQYERGTREPLLLKHITLLALRQKNQSRATQVGNEFIARAGQPYSKDSWAFMAAVTRTFQDAGFELLRAHTEEADAALGPNVAERTIRAVIRREMVEAHTPSQPGGWEELEQQASARYGALGTEAVAGSEMLFFLGQQDWAAFARSYTRYFTTAASRSDYPINNLSYQIFQHVSDPEVLKLASETVKRDVDAASGSPIKTDPTEIDTYANLLYRAGRRQEALQWDEKSASLSEFRDPEITGHLEKMKAGQPTWLGPGPSASARPSARD